MLCNQNEKYLLKYISSESNFSSNENNLLSVVCKLGIKLKFVDNNPVYRIIDELNYCSLNSIGKHYE